MHMDWARAVEINRIALSRIVAELFVMLGLVNAGTAETGGHSAGATNVKFEFGKLYVNNQIVDRSPGIVRKQKWLCLCTLCE